MPNLDALIEADRVAYKEWSEAVDKYEQAEMVHEAALALMRKLREVSEVARAAVYACLYVRGEAVRK